LLSNRLSTRYVRLHAFVHGCLVQSLKERVVELIPEKQKELKELGAKYGEKSLGNVTVSQCVGGARDVKCMLWETSLLDSQEARSIVPSSRGRRNHSVGCMLCAEHFCLFISAASAPCRAAGYPLPRLYDPRAAEEAAGRQARRGAYP